MPLPLLVPFAIGAAGLFGAAKTALAVKDNQEANNVFSAAERRVRYAQEDIDESREGCNSALEVLGQKKYESVTVSLKRFIDSYSKLKNVQLILKDDIGALKLTDFDDQALEEIRHDISMLESTAFGLGSGGLGGAMAAFGAYSGTMMLASAGTGTAIGALSGVAATNATLAWLGGGTLASGGLGMAGGTLVLGTLAAGPALLIFGTVLGAKAATKLNNAKSNLEEAREFEVESEVIVEKLKGISMVTNLAVDLLSNLKGKCRRASSSLEKVIETSGIDFGKYTDEEKEVVFKSVKYAQLIKAVIDTPILDQDGNLLGDTEANLSSFLQSEK